MAGCRVGTGRPGLEHSACEGVLRSSANACHSADRWDFPWDFKCVSWDFEDLMVPFPSPIQSRSKPVKFFLSKVCMASRKGIEPLTPGLGNLCSILLSYRDF
jgi:hypothetical protein